MGDRFLRSILYLLRLLAGQTHDGFYEDHYNSIGNNLNLKPEQIDGYFSSHQEFKHLLENQLSFVTKEVAAHYPEGKILDLGCGTGRYLKSLSAIPNLDLYGVDYSRSTLKNFTAVAVPKANLHCGNIYSDVTYVKSHPKYFDVILCIGALQHNSPRRAWALLKAIGKMSKQKGMLLMSFSHPRSLFDVFGNKIIRYWPWLVELGLRKQGFSVIRSGSWPNWQRKLWHDNSSSPSQEYWLIAKRSP